MRNDTLTWITFAFFLVSLVIVISIITIVKYKEGKMKFIKKILEKRKKRLIKNEQIKYRLLEEKRKKLETRLVILQKAYDNYWKIRYEDIYELGPEYVEELFCMENEYWFEEPFIVNELSIKHELRIETLQFLIEWEQLLKYKMQELNKDLE